MRDPVRDRERMRAGDVCETHAANTQVKLKAAGRAVELQSEPGAGSESAIGGGSHGAAHWTCGNELWSMVAHAPCQRRSAQIQCMDYMDGVRTHAVASKVCGVGCDGNRCNVCDICASDRDTFRCAPRISEVLTLEECASWLLWCTL